MIRLVIIKMRQNILFKVTDGEKKEIIDKAKETGLATASFCRFIILKEIRKENGKEKSSITNSS